MGLLPESEMEHPLDSGSRLCCQVRLFPSAAFLHESDCKNPKKNQVVGKKMNQRFKDSVSSGGICQCPDSSIHSFYPSVETMV